MRILLGEAVCGLPGEIISQLNSLLKKTSNDHNFIKLHSHSILKGEENLSWDLSGLMILEDGNARWGNLFNKKTYYAFMQHEQNTVRVYKGLAMTN